eukprot:TRINITY_DN6059_c2_g1_i1.p1 TRINITY_DN6059_c2_g1~~TRINITY_DN6059_c2_g1_i1.p1  ORF type:complete len:413 (+),score=61.39 TRINITY_DN6059_c2_g1_i1:97-1335(+)
MSLDEADPQQASVLAKCPFCSETFPPHIMTNHCNYCVDMLGQAEVVKMKRRLLAEAQIREAEAAKSNKGAVGGGVASTLRGMVSQNKIRFQEDGFDLDLTYITPRVIAMGFPSHGTEGYYRNPIDEVERFFETRHKNHYRIYNLCSERQYDHPNRFGGAYRRFPFDDHNPPSPISVIPRLCEDAAEWLAADPLNVLAVHCKAGKGRTGLIIAAFLMSTNSTLRKADDALKCFGDSRTHDGKGVTIPSQIRYVRYWETMLTQHNSCEPSPRILRLEKVVVHGSIKHGGCDPYFLVLAGSKAEILDSRKRLPTKLAQREWGFEWDLSGRGKEIQLCGDIKFVFKAKAGIFRGEDHLFHCWLNTGFAPESIRLDKGHLDKACKDTKHDTYREDLVVELFFTTVRQQGNVVVGIAR